MRFSVISLFITCDSCTKKRIGCCLYVRSSVTKIRGGRFELSVSITTGKSLIKAKVFKITLKSFL